MAARLFLQMLRTHLLAVTCAHFIRRVRLSEEDRAPSATKEQAKQQQA
jgi:hypothetical protein